MASLKSASCSSSSVTSGSWKYDAFLSFRGEDTRYNFVDHLYAALIQRGICVFKDDEELKTGKAISPELLKAIEESKFAVVVFSKNYANSSWCLAELSKIMEWHNRMGQRVIPVFYHVDPSDIRGQKNDVAVFFQQHEQRFIEELDKVKEWREALTATGNLSGHHISEAFKVGESTYIKKIVEEILGDIQPSDLDGNLVGIDSHMDELHLRLETEKSEEVRIVGIHGMGGIGKTTIAKAMFRRIAYKFEGSCFLNDVRENSYTKKDICTLQEKLLRKILTVSHNFNVEDPKDGANMIRSRFVNKKVLMVLDDVDDWKQLEFLSATHNSFGRGSRIIITTRNEQLLSNANATYKPDFLRINDALELFSRHAFGKNSPPEGYDELSRHAIHCAGYLPLAVNILGSFFKGRKAFEWESGLNRFGKTLDVKIYDTLKLSFDGLHDSEKILFLDIACFFKGKLVRDVTKLFESFGFDPQIGLSVLKEKSLITISSGVIGMHDLIQEMGLQINHESYPNSRLWQLEDIHDSLEHNWKLKAIQAIVLSDRQYDVDVYEEQVGFSANVFERMKNLRLLDIIGRFTSSEPTFLPANLRWLCWRKYPFTSLQLTRMSKLVGLIIVGGNIKQFWNGQKIMPNLKFLNLQHLDCLTTLPDVSVTPNIEKLYVIGCMNLVEVHESLGFHRRLVRLQIIGCKQLKRLPSRIEMESLRILYLNKCSSLQRFPDVSRCMVKLSFISLEYCFGIEELPSSVRYISSLGYLNMRRYASPMNINTQKTISLHNLANSCCLKTLNLSGRQMGSEDFPKNLEAFSYLENLDLSGNNKLIRLPSSFSYLSNLRRLNLNECRRLQILHALPSRIEVLQASNCCSLEKIDDLLKEYNCWNHISFINSNKLLEDEDSQRYLDKLLQQSLLKRCAAVDHSLTIGIPGNKIPTWFTEERPGHKVTLMIPPKCHTQINGIVVCGVFPGEWQGSQYDPHIDISFKKDGMCISEKEVDCYNASENGNMWISYRPFSSFRGFQHEGWSGLTISITKPNSGEKAVRCATRLMYKEDIEFCC